MYVVMKNIHVYPSLTDTYMAFLLCTWTFLFVQMTIYEFSSFAHKYLKLCNCPLPYGEVVAICVWVGAHLRAFKPLKWWMMPSSTMLHLGPCNWVQHGTSKMFGWWDVMRLTSRWPVGITRLQTPIKNFSPSQLLHGNVWHFPTNPIWGSHRDDTHRLRWITSLHLSIFQVLVQKERVPSSGLVHDGNVIGH